MVSGGRNRLIWLGVLIVSLAAGAAEPRETAEPNWVGTARTDLDVFPDRLKADAKATFFDQDNLAALAWAGFVSVAMNNGNADDDVAEYFDEHDTFSGFGDEALNILGAPTSHFPIAAAWYLLSAKDGDEPNRRRALTMLTALTINGVVVGGLKAIRQNDQPDGDVWAWPSGHTASSFTVASVLHEFYGLKVGIPAYIGAGAVAWRMMDDGDHWASDVVFGATLGWIVGHTVAGRHQSPAIAGFEVLPYYGRRKDQAMGLSFLRRF